LLDEEATDFILGRFTGGASRTSPVEKPRDRPKFSCQNIKKSYGVKMQENTYNVME